MHFPVCVEEACRFPRFPTGGTAAAVAASRQRWDTGTQVPSPAQRSGLKDLVSVAAAAAKVAGPAGLCSRAWGLHLPRGSRKGPSMFVPPSHRPWGQAGSSPSVSPRESHRPRRLSRGSSRVAARGWWLSSPHSQDLSGPRCVCQAGPSLLEMRVLHGLSRLRSSSGALCLLADVPQVLEGWVVAAGICLLVSPPCFLSVFALLSGTFLPLHQPFFAVVTVF